MVIPLICTLLMVVNTHFRLRLTNVKVENNIRVLRHQLGLLLEHGFTLFLGGVHHQRVTRYAGIDPTLYSFHPIQLTESPIGLTTSLTCVSGNPVLFFRGPEARAGATGVHASLGYLYFITHLVADVFFHPRLDIDGLPRIPVAVFTLVMVASGVGTGLIPRPAVVTVVEGTEA